MPDTPLTDPQLEEAPKPDSLTTVLKDAQFLVDDIERLFRINFDNGPETRAIFSGELVKIDFVLRSLIRNHTPKTNGN